MVAMVPTEDERAAKVFSLRPEHLEIERTYLLGMVVFLASWAMLFAALFYVFGSYRLSLSTWPPAGSAPLPVVLPLINTVVLALSSVAIHLGVGALRDGRSRMARLCLWGTVVLGAVFMALQWILWSSVWMGGLELDTSVYASFFYVLTAFHGLHVLVGFALLLWLVPQFNGLSFPLREVRARMVAMFWHFVDVVWVLLFLLVFVL